MLVVREIAGLQPEQAFAALSDEPGLVWLDSAAPEDARSRHAYLCARPFRRIEASDGTVTIDGMPVAGDPFSVLDAELARWRIVAEAAPVPFAGGAVGVLGYGLGRVLERLPARHPDMPGVPDMSVGFYDVVVGFDLHAGRCWLMSSGFPEQGPGRIARAAARADAVQELLEAVRTVPGGWTGTVRWQLELDRRGYEQMVSRVLDHIRAGDVFQANVAMRALAPRPDGASAAMLYQRLRATSPAPFGAFVACGSFALLSASPERFVRLDAAGAIETRPIKGTSPRSKDPAADRALREALELSGKDRAENLMIVDLMRNDIGRVAVLGSVAVPLLCGVESFASVHHLVSAVTAQLRPGLGPVDLLRATFPGGSVTGAPKVRAMEIIDAVEAAARGPYCGAVAWIGFDGAMDSSIVIRSVVATPDWLVAQAGGGIVADSDPAAEYDEMRLKLSPALRAFGGEAAR
jgi:para-aminobenzoate synthetase component 1